MEAHGFDISLSPEVPSAIDSDSEVQEVNLLGRGCHLPVQNAELQFFPHEVLKVLPVVSWQVG